MRIGLVTDSTAQLHDAEAARLRETTGGLFAVVPLTVLIDGVAYIDGELDPDRLCAAMDAGSEVSTSMATPARFAAAYADLIDHGAEAIIVVTMSGELSGTRDSAVTAATDQPVLIDVVDSRTTSAGLAGAVAVAAAGIGRGEDVASIAGTVADWCAGETMTVFAPQNLEHLRRGGRIGAASSLLGRALQIVPVLGLGAGVVTPVARVRTRAKALERMSVIAGETAASLGGGDRPLQVEIQHADGSPDAPDVVTLTEKLVDRGLTPTFRTLSPIITAHVGPGALGITVQTTP
ncbi:MULTISPECIES: DegV family protein [unclassified Brevibacterium]|uniref:DegV family protein n=1 Tax=unclassified Brevibacterium TaxID=2614124 RepID=UPI0010F7C65D|nr:MULTISPECIES: DegV family protein [unclassified Brevibacterium]MCM1012595.1 DegV family protein [Brevibacterium sp. XM4083]